MLIKKRTKISFLKQSIYIVLSFIIIFFILEISVRIFFPKFNFNSISYEKSPNHKILKGKDTFLFKDRISDKFLIRVKTKNKKISINPNQKKIIFIGDSVTLGLGVGFEDTFVENFKRKFKINNTQILAFSNLGINYNDIFYTISNEFPKILKEGDTIIYQFNYNDIVKFNNSEENIKKKIYFTNNILVTFQKFKFKYLNHSSLLKFLNHHFSLISKNTEGSCSDRKIEALGQYSYAFFSKGYEKEAKESWSNFEKQFSLSKTLLEKKNISFYVLITPVSLQLKNHKIVNKLNLDLDCSTKNANLYLKEILKKNSVGFIDPLGNFKDLQNDKFKLLFQEFDTNHPNKYGHELIGEEVYNKLSNLNK